MPKLTQTTDLEAVLPQTVQDRLTAEMTTAETKQALLEDMLDRAEGLAFSYLRGVYDIQALIDAKPPALVDVVTTIAKYRLYQRAGLRQEVVYYEQKDALSWLQDMGEGGGDLLDDNQPVGSDSVAYHGTASREGTLFNEDTYSL